MNDTSKPETKAFNLDKVDSLLIITTAAFFMSSWLVANVPIGEASTWVSALFIVFLAIPSYYYVLKWIGVKKGLVIIAFFGVFPIVIETIGILTGFPYGGFYYTDVMGFKILGLVPWSVAFAFAPLTLGAMVLATNITDDAWIALPLSALILVIIDLILDPAAVVLNIWVWIEPGPYYGIPITNYTGWFLTAFVASAFMHLLTMNNFKKTEVVPTKIASSMLMSVAFWTGFSLWTGLFIPVLIGIVLIAFTSYHMFYKGFRTVNQVLKSKL